MPAPTSFFSVPTAADAEFEALYTRYRGIVRGVATRVLRDVHDAEEVMDDVLLKLHAALASGRLARDETSVERWLRTVARRHALDVRKWRQRARGRDSRYGKDRLWRADNPDIDHALDASRAVRELERELPKELELVGRNLLSPGNRAALAEAMGITQLALSVRIHRALKRLRRELAQRGHVG